MKTIKKNIPALVRAAAATIVSFGLTVPLLAGSSTNTAGQVQQGTSDGGGNFANNNPAVTISFAGQTALKTYITSGSLTLLEPGTSIVLHDGTDGAPVTYTANDDANADVQLASKNFTIADKNPGTPTLPSTSDLQIASAIRGEWDEVGSVDGFYELLNDEVGYVPVSDGGTGEISNSALRAPSVSNPVAINQTVLTAPTSATGTNGFILNAVSDPSDTYNPAIYNQATGVNIQGGQNRVQFSIGEYPTEALAVGGTASPFASAGSAGYGQGNPALAQSSTLTALGVAGARQSFQPTSAANESTDKVDPNTGSNYTSGPWNTAGANNVTSTAFSVTAVTYSANPGTGLQRIDKGDAQWLQTTGRLQNGALFDVVARTVNTGQRVVFALNTGIDPSWAVGSNDDGNSTTTAAANAQHSIGPSYRYDGKTSGSEAETTISQGRMAVGALSVPEATAAKSNAPVRALDVDFNDQTDINPADDSTNFIRADFSSIVSSASNRYQAVLISHLNTVKSPDQTALNNELTALGIDPGSATAAQQQAAWALVQSFDPSTAETDSTPSTAPISGIKGDITGDVAALLANDVNSVGTAAAGLTATTATNPADGLFANGYLIPGLLNYTRVTDGGPITPVTLSPAAQSEQAQVQANYGSLFTTDGTAGANANTIGSASTYGNAAGGTLAINGTIPITSKNADGSAAANGTIAPAGNYLFGNFNQNGVRDFSAVEQSVNAALSLFAVDGAKNSIFTPDGGVTNSTVIPSLVGTPGWVTTGTDTKGDLIVLGDFNGDGKFDGQDIYLLATGASLADSTSSNTLTATAATFSDAVRNPNAVLRKNAALDYVNNYLNTTTDTSGAAFLRQTAAAILEGTSVPFGATPEGTDPVNSLLQYSYDPNGVNAFNKNDVNRDGVVDFNDAILVDQYNGQSYQNLTQSLAATQQTPVTGAVEALSLVAVQQVDGEAAIGSADVAVLNTGLTGAGNANWYGYNVQKSGPGAIAWQRTGGTVTVYNGASFEISSGTVQVGGTLDPFSDNNVSGPTAGNHVAVTVDHGAALQFTQNGLTSKVGGLSIDTNSGSTVNLTDNNLDIVFGSSADPVSTIRSYLVSGYNSGAWNGPGINSSTAASSGGKFAIGYRDASDAGGVAGEIQTAYALVGDTNLDGTVNLTDLLSLLNSYGQIGQDWTQGDFNYDGSVNLTDLLSLLNNYGISGGNVGTSASVAQGAQVVPEPVTGSLIMLGAGALLARRRRNR